MERRCDVWHYTEKGLHAYPIHCTKRHNTGSPFQQRNLRKAECSAISDGRSILVMSPTVSYMAGDIDTKTLKHDVMHKWSDSSESATEDFTWM